jgi:hypothetical protein
MNQKMLSMPAGLGVINVGEMLAAPGLLALEKSKTSRRLPANAERLIEGAVALLDELVLSVIEKRTANEFTAARDKAFPQYFNVALGLSYLIRVMVPRRTLEVLSGESFSELEAEFRENGERAFGAEIRDQAIFTAWTLRKISDICQRIDQAPLADGLKGQDFELFSEFAYYSMRTRFSLDCLSKSMSYRKALYPEVLPIVMDGLRAAVNAYAWARRALDLRVPAPTQIGPSTAEWDEEDQALLNEATHDVLAEPV